MIWIKYIDSLFSAQKSGCLSKIGHYFGKFQIRCSETTFGRRPLTLRHRGHCRHRKDVAGGRRCACSLVLAVTHHNVRFTVVATESGNENGDSSNREDDPEDDQAKCRELLTAVQGMRLQLDEGQSRKDIRQRDCRQNALKQEGGEMIRGQTNDSLLNSHSTPERYPSTRSWGRG